jgi:16S rRNA (uracil1498-N3)-methyltransferase
MHRAYAPAATPPSVELSSGEAHHITRVLRLRVGDDLVVFDGGGREWLGRIVSTAEPVVVDLVEPRVPAAEASVFVTIGIGLLKGDQMDAVVRDVTMLGVMAVAPFVSAHVAIPDGARQTRSIERWQRVAIASAKQSGRAVVPAVEPIVVFEKLLASHIGELIVLCAEPNLRVSREVAPLSRPERALVLVGPEGGWAASEIGAARAAGAHVLDLGPRTLRAETAPTVALSALWTMWGWR